ncbi:response regulator [Aliibacillus thermotolerans]|uniref:Response regulator n=1 Tax=Aliibacillus thermotolerans TaxID=1834418 RepID=A0ABW0U4I9_9BACI|nr:response regulator [Aliibacillus thermotolerans]MDA3129392.1 response regulator [Aliibacillus thermotolerans]
MDKILIVDDQDGIRSLLKALLSEEGYEVLEADNGDTALQLLETETIDLLLLDLKMPDRDGIDILMERKQRKLAEKTTVILITAYEEVGMVEEAKKLGAVSCILKPFDIDKLKETLRTYLMN